jgi:hypothetical protein
VVLDGVRLGFVVGHRFSFGDGCGASSASHLRGT